MTPATCRAARAGLDIPVRELARIASISTNTLSRYEGGGDLQARTVKAIREALEGAGATFLDDDGAGPGVRLRPQPTA